MNILDQITQDYKKNDVPEFNVGDTVKVHVKIIEGQRERSRYSKAMCSRCRMAVFLRLSL